MVQKYTSADTSINTVSAVYKNLNLRLQFGTVLDYGGGKYNTNNEYMQEHYDCKVIVYDPYNRSKEHNNKVLNYFIKHPAKYVVCSNVLNVIKEDEIIYDILKHIYSLMGNCSTLFIKVYERDKTGIGCETTKGWQRNQKLKDYILFVQQVFGKESIVSIKKGILEVKKN